MKKTPDLSARLNWLASNVSKESFADIGTDHAYVPIYLALQGKVKKAIAADVAKGPLEIAKKNIEDYHLEKLVETRLSDGLKNIENNEVESVLIAGMGGMLIKDILEADPDKTKSFESFLLSPHSDHASLRRCLYDLGFEICKEDMIFDEGKYYLLIEAKNKSDDDSQGSPEDDELKDVYLEYGKLLIESKNEVLKAYLLKSKSTYENILKNVMDKSPEGVIKVQKELDTINKAIELMK